MAATHSRRRREPSLAESATYSDSSLQTNDNPKVRAEFVLSVDSPSLTCRQLVFRILQISGPYTANELHRMVNEKYRRTYSVSSIEKALRELKALKLVIRLNGGYAVTNWMQIGA